MVRDSERQFLAAIRNLYFFRNTHRRIYFKGISSCIGTIRRQIFLHISSHTRTRDYAVCSKRQGRREMENTEKQKTPKELKAWEKERKLIPVMIKKYCHGKHGTKGEEVCEECRALTEYALFRLEKCPFKVNKKFCSFCKIHCYKPDMREKIKDVMKWSGPRMIFTHPVFAFKHVFQMVSYKRKLKKEAKAKANV